MSQERNAKASILNYVENFIDRRDQELRGASSDEDDYQRKRRIDRDAIVIKSGDDDFRLEQLVNILPNFCFSSSWTIFLGTTCIDINRY